MAGIRGKGTKPEMVLRRGLHRLGFRFQLHRRDLPGTPDLVFPKYGAVLFAQGCFWHGHQCHLFKWPSTRPTFWKEKIQGNRQRDAEAVIRLRDSGWRVGIVWECALKGRSKVPLACVLEKCENWLGSSDAELEISGIEAGSPL
jgi:DNA mismatch endonuclease (patch repair protein)